MTEVVWLIQEQTSKQTKKQVRIQINLSKQGNAYYQFEFCNNIPTPHFEYPVPKSSDMGEAGFAACLVELYICFVCCHLLRKLKMENLYHKLYIQDRQA